MKIHQKLPKIGDSASNMVTYSTEMVINYAQLVGDKNPIHLSEDYAKETIFKKRLVHGTLVAGQISNLIASKLPGPGSIFIFQDLNFKNPVYHGDIISCLVKVVDLKKSKNIAFLETVMTNEHDEIVIFGSAVIKIV
jgi:3-hydroxybutyryl-CoA dehydratase